MTLLPNGAWIDLAQVCLIKPFDVGHGFGVDIHVGGGVATTVRFKSYQEAEAYAEQLARLLNDDD